MPNSEYRYFKSIAKPYRIIEILLKNKLTTANFLVGRKTRPTNDPINGPTIQNNQRIKSHHTASYIDVVDP